MVNVHASGGARMLAAAADAISHSPAPPILIAVTVLTSMSDEELAAMGVNHSAQQQVKLLAKLSRDNGLDGVVCSAQEVQMIKALCGEPFQCVTPGIRPIGASIGDQSRVMTPQAAMKAGSDYLVIGRPITAAEQPLEALQSIRDSMSEAL